MLKLLIKTIKGHLRPVLLLILTLGSYFSIVFWKILNFRPDGIYAGHVNVWSDWALHIAIANIVAFKSPIHWLSYHPLYADGKFTYPILSDFISGIFMRFGLPLKASFVFPSIALVVILLVGLYFLFYLVTKSRGLAVMAVFIFFLSAGSGFIDFIKDFWQNPSWELLKYPLRDYGRYEAYQWYAGNMAVGLLIPQRAFLLGLAFGVWAVNGVLYVISKGESLSYRLRLAILISAGVLAGILPIGHAHSFIALIAVTGFLCLFNLKKWRLWYPYAVVAGLLSSILYFIFIWGGIESGSFSKWHPGYTSDGDFFDWLRMWFRLWGAMLPVVIYGLYRYRKEIDISRWGMYAGAAALFIAGNLFLFQPIGWDNSKLFWWSYLIFSAMAAIVIGKIWSGNNIFRRSGAVLLCAAFIFLGSLEFVRLVQTDKNDYMMTSNDDINLGLEIREKTGPLDVFLTAPSHNHFIMVWASRPILMGYTAWVWNFGFRYAEREADMKMMFLGTDNTPTLLKKYNISYVVIGPTEIHDLSANENYFRSNFPLAFQNYNYRIYDTRLALD